MYSRKIQYKKPDLDVVNTVLKNVSDDHQDHDDLQFFVANLHQVSFTKFADWSEEELNNLLSRNNIDVSIFEKEKDNTEERQKRSIVFDHLVEIVSQNVGEYKSEIIKRVIGRMPEITKGKVRTAIRKYCRLGILEQTKHETSNKNVLSKGRYWTSYFGKDK